MTARTERYDEVLAMRRCHKDVNKCIGDRMSECRSDSWRDKESGEAGKSHAWRGWPIRVCWSTGLFHKRGWVPVTSIPRDLHCDSVQQKNPLFLLSNTRRKAVILHFADAFPSSGIGMQVEFGFKIQKTGLGYLLLDVAQLRSTDRVEYILSESAREGSTS